VKSSLFARVTLIYIYIRPTKNAGDLLGLRQEERWRWKEIANLLAQKQTWILCNIAHNVFFCDIIIMRSAAR
jgi:hypothetical protein